MNVNYNSLSTGRDTLLKNGIGDTVGSPPISSSKAMRKSWLVMFVLLLSMTFGQLASAQSIVNYAFSSSTTGSLDDLSSGATTMLTGANDDVATAVFPIGFDFWFMGVKYTHFSANSNGQFRFHASAAGPAIGSNVSTLGANAVTLAPMSGDNEVNNGMRFRVDGTAPNRKLIIEWNQFYVNFVNLTNAGNMQAWLSETTGKIDFVYGEIFNSSTSSQTRSIFISSSNTATTAGSITIGAVPVWTPSATLTVNTIAAGANPVGAPLVANLGSAAQGSRVVYSWTPNSVAPTDPTTLTFTAVTVSTTTPNWVDNSTDEAGFLVTRALDAGFTTGVVTTFVPSTTVGTTGTAYTSAQTGLTAGNTYFYRVQLLLRLLEVPELQVLKQLLLVLLTIG
ncbi:MAG: hypothetical protein IPP30_10685 [Flavobacterium sp.]|nr:hypothetical protein [Flavobacterium sp.]